MSIHAFSRCFRLTTPQDFQHVFSQARRSSDRFFTVLFAPGKTSTARLGFAVARKKIPASIRRNRVRRIGRESFRRHRDTLSALDIIILPQPAAGKAANTELFASLALHWQRLQRATGAQPGSHAHS